MLVGMGTVFFFLTVLVGATTLMSRLLGRVAPAQVPTVSGSDQVTDDEVAAIAAAIQTHRQRS